MLTPWKESYVQLFVTPVDCDPPGSSVHGDSPGKNTGMGCHALLQRIFPTQGLNLRLYNLDSIFKSRDVTLLTKVRLVKAMVYPVVMYGCESWTVKKARSVT